jgi:hypothetical protein
LCDNSGCEEAKVAWLSFWYQYLGGGVIFLVGLWFTFRQGEVGIRTPKGRKNLLMLLGGFFVIFGLQLGMMLLGSTGE